MERRKSGNRKLKTAIGLSSVQEADGKTFALTSFKTVLLQMLIHLEKHYLDIVLPKLLPTKHLQ